MRTRKIGFMGKFIAIFVCISFIWSPPLALSHVNYIKDHDRMTLAPQAELTGKQKVALAIGIGNILADSLIETGESTSEEFAQSVAKQLTDPNISGLKISPEDVSFKTLTEGIQENVRIDLSDLNYYRFFTKAGILGRTEKLAFAIIPVQIGTKTFLYAYRDPGVVKDNIWKILTAKLNASGQITLAEHKNTAFEIYSLPEGYTPPTRKEIQKTLTSKGIKLNNVMQALILSLAMTLTVCGSGAMAARAQAAPALPPRSLPAASIHAAESGTIIKVREPITAGNFEIRFTPGANNMIRTQIYDISTKMPITDTITFSSNSGVYLNNDNKDPITGKMQPKFGIASKNDLTIYDIADHENRRIPSKYFTFENSITTPDGRYEIRRTTESIPQTHYRFSIIVLYDKQTGKMLRFWHLPADYTIVTHPESFSVSNDGKYYAFAASHYHSGGGYFPRNIYVLNLQDPGKPVLNLEISDIYFTTSPPPLTFDFDGDTLEVDGRTFDLASAKMTAIKPEYKRFPDGRGWVYTPLTGDTTIKYTITNAMSAGEGKQFEIPVFGEGKLKVGTVPGKKDLVRLSRGYSYRDIDLNTGKIMGRRPESIFFPDGRGWVHFPKPGDTTINFTITQKYSCGSGWPIKIPIFGSGELTLETVPGLEDGIRFIRGNEYRDIDFDKGKVVSEGLISNIKERGTPLPQMILPPLLYRMLMGGDSPRARALAEIILADPISEKTNRDPQDIKRTTIDPILKDQKFKTHVVVDLSWIAKVAQKTDDLADVISRAEEFKLIAEQMKAMAGNNVVFDIVSPYSREDTLKIFQLSDINLTPDQYNMLFADKGIDDVVDEITVNETEEYLKANPDEEITSEDIKQMEKRILFLLTKTMAEHYDAAKHKGKNYQILIGDETTSLYKMVYNGLVLVDKILTADPEEFVPLLIAWYKENGIAVPEDLPAIDAGGLYVVPPDSITKSKMADFLDTAKFTQEVAVSA